MFRSTSSSTFGCWDLLNFRRNFRRVGLKGQHLMNTDKRSGLSQTLFVQAVSCFVTVTSAIPSISHWVFFPLHFAAVQTQPLCTARQHRTRWGQKKAQDSPLWVFIEVVSKTQCGSAAHCGAQRLQRVPVLESKTLSAAELQLL